MRGVVPILVAPTEPRVLKTLGKVSSLPERHGADVLFPANGGLIGIQRKQIDDLIASVQDGRLAKEVAQLQSVAFSVLIVEGRLKWSSEGMLVGRDYGIQWSRSTHRNLLMSVQAQGIRVETSDDANDTVAAILNLQEWIRKPKHHGLLKRPGPVSVWGKATNRDWACHLMQSFEGIGPELAGRIVDYFGKPPLEWKVDVKALQEVDGLGPKKAQQMWEALA